MHLSHIYESLHIGKKNKNKNTYSFGVEFLNEIVCPIFAIILI